MDRRQFNKAVAAGAATALAPFGIARAQSAKLKVGVILPRTGVQGLIGQSCQIGADIAPALIKDMLGVDIELMNADWETHTVVSEGVEHFDRIARLRSDRRLIARVKQRLADSHHVVPARHARPPAQGGYIRVNTRVLPAFVNSSLSPFSSNFPPVPSAAR